MESKPPYVTVPFFHAPTTPEVVTIDGVECHQAGIVIDGVVYLSAEYKPVDPVDIQAVAQRVAQVIRRRSGAGGPPSPDTDGQDVHLQNLQHAV